MAVWWLRRLRAPATALGTSALATSLYVRGADQEFVAVSESELPLTYDPDRISTVWSTHPRCVLARMRTIALAAVPFSARLVTDFIVHRRDEPASQRDARHAERARELRNVLTDLGPTFIKFGQMLSIRPDVLPPPAVYELQKLCDAVPSYPTADALRLIEAELGRPAAEVFSGLDEVTTPIAAASLGQVYRCRLIDGGAEVAVKVQRPDMIRSVSLDLFILRQCMFAVEWFKTRVLIATFGSADRLSFDVALLDTFARASYLELDYMHEASNLERFQSELVPRMGGLVYVPSCERPLTTRKVLVTEWIEGEQLARSPPDVIKRLTAVGVACFLAQLLDVGFFHSDPHPGNLLVDAQGRLVLIDFGLCAEIAAFDSRALTSAIVHLMRADVDALIEDGVLLRFLPPDVDRAALAPPLRRIFEQGRVAAAEEIARLRVDKSGAPSRGGGGGGRMAGDGDRMDQYSAMATKRAQFSAISRDLNQIFFEFPFTVPEYFALITRALIVLEGIALTGDPDFDLFNAAYPIAARHAASLFGASNLAMMLGEASTLAAAEMPWLSGATHSSGGTPKRSGVRSASGSLMASRLGPRTVSS